MRVNRIVLSVCLLLGSGSALAQKVNTDYDRSVDFSQYKTYAWLESKNPASELAHKRIIAAIDEQLAAKGIQEQTHERPDMYVVYHVGLKERVEIKGYNYGYYRPRWGGGTVRFEQHVYSEATLVLDMVNAERNELLWRAVAVGTVSDNPEKNARKIKKAAAKMFKKFPPGEK